MTALAIVENHHVVKNRSPCFGASVKGVESRFAFQTSQKLSIGVLSQQSPLALILTLALSFRKHFC
jgi:hypothetical protein